MKLLIVTQAGAKFYSLIVREDDGTERGGETVEIPIAGIPAWRIVKMREDLFDRLINFSGAEAVRMTAIPQLKSLEVVQWNERRRMEVK